MGLFSKIAGSPEARTETTEQLPSGVEAITNTPDGFVRVTYTTGDTAEYSPSETMVFIK